MNAKVVASFVSFVVLLAVWVALAITARPELSGILQFVQGACVTAWTASALFFETSTPIENKDTADGKLSQ